MKLANAFLHSLTITTFIVYFTILLVAKYRSVANNSFVYQQELQYATLPLRITVMLQRDIQEYSPAALECSWQRNLMLSVPYCPCLNLWL